MAGTYLQQDVYGDIPDAKPVFSHGMGDHELIEAIRSVPAVARARNACGSSWIVATALYQPKAGVLRAPHTTTPECWLAFVDREEHSTPGWTKVPLVLFGSYERNENAFKVMLPALFPQQSVVFLNHALPQARCMSLPHLVRAKELAKEAADRPHLLASKIPGWSGRAVLPGQLEMTLGYLQRRNAAADLAEYSRELSRMTSAGFNTSHRLPITDTLWMIWPTGDEVSQKMSKLWLHEVARHSSYEKVSYAWIISQVPEFKARLTDAVYIYSPDQRNCDSDGSVSREAVAPKNGSRKARRRGMRRLFAAGKHRAAV